MCIISAAKFVHIHGVPVVKINYWFLSLLFITLINSGHFIASTARTMVHTLGIFLHQLLHGSYSGYFSVSTLYSYSGNFSASTAIFLQWAFLQWTLHLNLSYTSPVCGSYLWCDLLEMNRWKCEGDITICDGCLDSKDNEKGNFLGAPSVTPIHKFLSIGNAFVMHIH